MDVGEINESDPPTLSQLDADLGDDDAIIHDIELEQYNDNFNCLCILNTIEGTYFRLSFKRLDDNIKTIEDLKDAISKALDDWASSTAGASFFDTSYRFTLEDLETYQSDQALVYYLKEAGLEDLVVCSDYDHAQFIYSCSWEDTEDLRYDQEYVE